MRTDRKNHFKNTAALAGAALALLLLLRHAEQAKAGMAEALSLCGSVMIPSLFPMLVLSQFAARCRCPPLLQRAGAKPLRALFGLSPGCLIPVLLGLTGGYPLAARAAAAARAEGLISPEDARRVTLFFTCPGIPFAVLVAGDCFRSRLLGATLLASCAAADVLAAFCGRLLLPAQPPQTEQAPVHQAEALSERLVRSVESATGAMLSICAWIAAFTALLRIVNAVTGGASSALLPLAAEVTAALQTAAARRDLPLTAACLAFGGLCVFCQLLPDINAAKTGAARFLAVRLACAGLAWLTETALLRLLALPVPTETRVGGAYLSADSVAGSVALLFLCAVFMAETARGDNPWKNAGKP